jgi:NTE family protein
VAEEDVTAQDVGYGLALSGGGYRAMLFHLGVLWRVNELAMLGEIDRVSSVSGGSLIAGRLAASWPQLAFENGIATNFRTEVTNPILSFSQKTIDVPAILLGLLPFIGAPQVAARYYRGLVGDLKLRDLPGPPAPDFVLNASHLNAGVGWRFTRRYMGSYRLGKIANPELSLATAMAASAAFPPVLSPLVLKPDPASVEYWEGANLYDRIQFRRTISLSDGGVYDNLGLEGLGSSKRRYRAYLVSDAGGELRARAGSFNQPLSQILRVFDTAGEQGRARRRQDLLAKFKTGKARGSLWRTGTQITNVEKWPAFGTVPFSVHSDWPHHLAAVRTRLNHFNEQERSLLVNWGYLVADVALRSFVVRDAAAPAALPFPRYGFESPPPEGKEISAGPPPTDPAQDEAAPPPAIA